MEKMSMPMAYAMKKKSGRHMCEGGGCEHSSHFAEGGNVNVSSNPGHSRENEKGIHSDMGGGISKAGTYARTDMRHKSGQRVTDKGAGWAKEEHGRVLSEMKAMPKPELYAEGGSVEDEGESIHPMVKRIMMGRAEGYSEGGHVANAGEDELDEMADGKPNDFDDLALDDHLEGHNSGAADGDNLGDAEQDDERSDIVSRIMKSRAKKDRMAVPGEGTTYGRNK